MADCHGSKSSSSIGAVNMGLDRIGGYCGDISRERRRKPLQTKDLRRCQVGGIFMGYSSGEPNVTAVDTRIAGFLLFCRGGRGVQ